MENPNENVTTTVTRDEGSVGPVIATIIILAVIVLGGLYFWGERGNRTNDEMYAPTDTTETKLNSSDDTNSIEADLNSTDTEDEAFDIQAS